jgi:hypothetical protein
MNSLGAFDGEDKKPDDLNSQYYISRMLYKNGISMDEDLKVKLYEFFKDDKYNKEEITKINTVAELLIKRYNSYSFIKDSKKLQNRINRLLDKVNSDRSILKNPQQVYTEIIKKDHKNAIGGRRTRRKNRRKTIRKRRCKTRANRKRRSSHRR